MPTSAKTCQPAPPSAADALAKLEAEIANVPVELDAAERDGDEARLTSLLARERILRRQLPAAQRAALEEELAPLAEKRDAAVRRRQEVARKIEEYKLAADVFAAAAERLRTGEAQLAMNGWNQVDRRIRELTRQIEELA